MLKQCWTALNVSTIVTTIRPRFIKDPVLRTGMVPGAVLTVG
jgi:hypothetical protein